MVELTSSLPPSSSLISSALPASSVRHFSYTLTSRSTPLSTPPPTSPPPKPPSPDDPSTTPPTDLQPSAPAGPPARKPLPPAFEYIDPMSSTSKPQAHHITQRSEALGLQVPPRGPTEPQFYPPANEMGPSPLRPMVMIVGLLGLSLVVVFWDTRTDKPPVSAKHGAGESKGG